jgi:hypothetical protein
MLLGIYLIITTLLLAFAAFYFLREVCDGLRYINFGDGLIGLGVVALFAAGVYLSLTQVIHLHINFTFAVSQGS